MSLLPYPLNIVIPTNRYKKKTTYEYWVQHYYNILNMEKRLYYDLTTGSSPDTIRWKCSVVLSADMKEEVAIYLSKKNFIYVHRA